MKTIYRVVESAKATGSANLSKQLSRMVRAGFTEANGAVLFKTQGKLLKATGPESFPDLTGYECFLNHVHVEDYLDKEGATADDLLIQGVAFAHKVLEKLSSSFQDKSFRVIVALNESGCSVRFHMVRNNESWLSDDLEKYGREAILVLES